MAQILDLSKRYTKEQIDSSKSSTFNDLPAGGYICKIVRPVLNDNPSEGKANIELNVDIAEGEYKGYFQTLEDRYGFWGLRGWMSFKDDQLGRFQQTCVALCNSNPGLQFNPFAAGGVDIDILTDKVIGVVIGKAEYRSNSGDIREKNVVSYFTEVERIRNKKFKVPELQKIKEDKKNDWIKVDSSLEEIPY